MEALTKVADGRATKIIIPSELQNMAGLVTTIGELLKDDKKKLIYLKKRTLQK